MSREDILARIPERWGKYCDVGDGWMSIVDELNAKLAKLDPDYTVAQVKEKFGGLRYYLAEIDPKVRDDAYRLIEQAEMECAVTCEVCGKPGTLRPVAWHRTLCDHCHENRKSPWY